VLNFQSYPREKKESADEEPVKDESDLPAGSYYYDDATGYDLYRDEDDNIAELQDEN
jgi:hypothetical protein